eukprot:3661433-Amphidinium_carterae.1
MESITSIQCCHSYPELAFPKKGVSGIPSSVVIPIQKSDVSLPSKKTTASTSRVGRALLEGKVGAITDID